MIKLLCKCRKKREKKIKKIKVKIRIRIRIRIRFIVCTLTYLNNLTWSNNWCLLSSIGVSK